MISDNLKASYRYLFQMREDVGDGDHSSMACIPSSAQGTAKLLVKDDGIIAGVEFAKMIFHYID
jgi:nicotinate-nucleotide pyrophosphorylase (carboxylating)